MAEFSRLVLSGSADGLPINVAGASIGAATTIHDAVAASDKDELWLWAYNYFSADEPLTIGWNGTGSLGYEQMQIEIPFQDGAFLVVPGISLSGASRVVAFTGVASRIAIVGHVNRITG